MKRERIDAKLITFKSIRSMWKCGHRGEERRNDCVILISFVLALHSHHTWVSDAEPLHNFPRKLLANRQPFSNSRRDRGHSSVSVTLLDGMQKTVRRLVRCVRCGFQTSLAQQAACFRETKNMPRPSLPEGLCHFLLQIDSDALLIGTMQAMLDKSNIQNLIIEAAPAALQLY